MTGLSHLWLPILLSSVFVMIASNIIHLLLPWHKNEYPKLPDQDKVMDVLRPFALPPGDYMVPRPSSMKEMGSPEFLDKMSKGPVLVLTVLPNGPTPMATNLVLWFVYSLVVSVFTAYISGRGLPPAAPLLDVLRSAGVHWASVFRVAGVTSFIGYALALWQMSIWYRRAWSTTLKATLDGLIYAIITGATFAWLWPH
jgi:hypothetical protein